MLKKNLVSGFAFVLIFLIGLMMVGCSVSPSSGVDYSYYYPDWTPDGKIICVKKAEYWTETTPWPFGAPTRSVSDTKYYITTMSQAGTQETNIKEINSLGKVAASPLGNYIAYTDGDYLKVITVDGNVFSDLNADDSIGAVDWSPGENTLVFSTNGASWESYLVDIDGQNKRRIFVGISPAWSYDGTRIVYDVYYYIGDASVWEGIFLYEISSEVSTKITSGEGGDPDFLLGDESIIYDNGTNYNIEKRNLSTGITTNLLDEEVYFPKVSFDGGKILYSKGANQGIWFSNIDGTGFEQLK